MINYPDFASDPRYQRMVQRLHRIRPEQRAILNTLAIDEGFADERIRRNLQALSAAADKDYRNRALSLRSKAFTNNLSNARQVFKSGLKDAKNAEMIGLGQVASEAYYGNKREKIDNEILRRRMQFMNRYLGEY